MIAPQRCVAAGATHDFIILNGKRKALNGQSKQPGTFEQGGSGIKKDPRFQAETGDRARLVQREK